MDYLTNLKKQMELEGRRKLTTVFPSINWKFTRDQYAEFDAATRHKNKTVIAEIKTRTFPIYEFETCYLELNKLIALSTCGADQIIYVAHYTNGKTATWNITNLANPTVNNKRMPYSTADSNLGTTHKDVIELKLSDADIRYTSTGIKTTQYNNH